MTFNFGAILVQYQNLRTFPKEISVYNSKNWMEREEQLC